MRPLPRGRVLQRNLDTHYVRLDGVVQSLAREGFTGYVRCVFEEGGDGVFAFRDGDLVAVLSERAGAAEPQRGLEGLTDLSVRLHQERAFLDVCRLEPELMASILALLHGVPRPFDPPPLIPADIVQHGSALRLTGAVWAGNDVAAFFADGELLGWHLPAVDEWMGDLNSLPAEAMGWLTVGLSGAHALRTVDLNEQKVRLFAGLEQTMARFVPEYGGHLFGVETVRQETTDVKKMAKGDFVRLAFWLSQRARLLVGETRARELHDALRVDVDNMIDVGI